MASRTRRLPRALPETRRPQACSCPPPPRGTAPAAAAGRSSDLWKRDAGEEEEQTILIPQAQDRQGLGLLQLLAAQEGAQGQDSSAEGYRLEQDRG
ncbi:hypothetical protein ANANG_G00240700 [Anguilla anguilla]|uniref:Uncharacterized protein n=1 Tax=Anguilla anguilla TaxID=7936 RepID=A0A9D3RPG1_ANGAN|nr:hypothetical protein ANANG_G00240700 [Anguilla anguilla]